MKDPKIIVALDFENLESVRTLLPQLSPGICRVKVGKELFTNCGPAVIEILQTAGFEVFLDLKFHDIPATVAKACKAAANLGVWMINVHALGGNSMLQAARDAIPVTDNGTKLIAVTLLTSHNQQEIDEIGLSGTITENVQRLAGLSKSIGLDGVVCSARETTILRETIGKEFLLVTPGIRPTGVVANDQKRIVTPKQALLNGSNYLVIGRPITQSEDPAKALTNIVNSFT